MGSVPDPKSDIRFHTPASGYWPGAPVSDASSDSPAFPPYIPEERYAAYIELGIIGIEPDEMSVEAVTESISDLWRHLIMLCLGILFNVESPWIVASLQFKCPLRSYRDLETHVGSGRGPVERIGLHDKALGIGEDAAEQ